ncbi:MAG: 50S ribosomal protein L17 [Nitrospinae bacterium]|nr:50S ribosomal protein L17 [Nitrospinota bacterium]MZH04865.1 50S ribosomal protein L17 [Nitrospinota bacterium]MZH14308.1 50S ribosomal protein L17 [Nitrospinota bacterium]
MRHLKAGRKFGRSSAHRKALFRNLVGALIQRERIRTTLAKAKELRGKVEKTITLGKKGTLHARRQAFKLAPQKESVSKVFGDLAERYANRPGGYTRIIKIGPRRGDNAPMAFIELVDREGEAPAPKKGKEAAKKETKPKATEKKAGEKKEAKPKATEKKAAEKKETKKKAEPKKSAPKKKEDKK